ncbi:MAG TPA: hypothetical protein VIY66_00545 [Candidatus Acidoferrales bacterium]
MAIRELIDNTHAVGRAWLSQPVEIDHRWLISTDRPLNAAQLTIGAALTIVKALCAARMCGERRR